MIECYTTQQGYQAETGRVQGQYDGICIWLIGVSPVAFKHQ